MTTKGTATTIPPTKTSLSTQAGENGRRQKKIARLELAKTVLAPQRTEVFNAVIDEPAARAMFGSTAES